MKLKDVIRRAKCGVLGALFAALGAGFAQADMVPFLDYEPATKSFVMATNECTLVTDKTRELADGWYAVKGNVVLEAGANLTVSGDAHLILCDGASLTIANPAENSAAIVVGKSESLTIYGATNGTGRLEATGGSWSAGIGGRTGNPTGGTVTINGGAIAAQGGAGASEMGAGEGSTQGKVWINGGIFAVRPKDEWLAVFRIVVENTDDATKVPNGYRVILNAVANAILPTAKVHVKKYGETYAEITGTQTNECGCLADAIAAAQAAPQGSVELVTNVNETVRKFQETYGFFPTNMIVRLLTDVKDCVECTVISEYYPEIAVTLDLNGFSLTGTGFIAVFGFIVWPLTFRKIVSVIPYYELKKDRAGAQGARLAHQDALRPVREAGRGRSIVTTTGRRSARFSRS